MTDFFLNFLLSDQRSHIFDAMAEHNFEKGEVIIKQGDPGDYFYVIGKLANSPSSKLN